MLDSRTDRRVVLDFDALFFPLHVFQSAMSAEDSGLNCLYCYSSRLRFSRFHLFDIPRLLFLQLPVRCRSCGERFYANIFVAWKLGFVKKTGQKPAPARDNKDESAATRDSHAV